MNLDSLTYFEKDELLRLFLHHMGQEFRATLRTKYPVHYAKLCERPGYECASVVGGWQTRCKATGELLGPICNDIADVWRWQGANLGVRS